MNRAFLKHFLVILIILLICSGCKQSTIIGDDFLTAKSDPSAIKYKNGTILVKNNEQYDIKTRENFTNPNVSVGEIKFGPKNMNFGK